MKLAHRKLSPLISLLLAGLALSSSAWATPVSYYYEAAVFQGVTYGANSTPHNAPITYSTGTSYTSNTGTGDTSNTSFSASESATFSSTPAPSIITRTSAYSPSGISTAQSGAYLYYDIGISGPASTWVPVTFQGQFSMQGNYIAGDATSGFNARNSTRINLTIGGDVTFDYTCSRHQCTPSTYSNEHSWVTWNLTTFGIDSVEGNILGAEDILTDAFGHAKKTVYMSAGASTFVGAVPWESSAMAFLDPEFHIDAAWLALNPGATLSLPQGVGNSITPSVPEPETYTLMLAGLGLVGWMTRRKKQSQL
jgi:hypothetical protein